MEATARLSAPARELPNWGWIVLRRNNRVASHPCHPPARLVKIDRTGRAGHTMNGRPQVTLSIHRPIPALGIFCFVLFAISLSSAGALEVDPQAEEVLRGLSRTLNNASALHCAVLVEIQISAGEMKNQTVTRGELTLSRPNRLRLEVTGGKIPFTLVSDGTTTTTLIRPLAAYTESKAPEAPIGFLKGIEGNLISQQVPFLPFLFLDDPYGYFVADSGPVKYAGLEDIEGVPCHRLTIHQGESELNLWFDQAESSLLRLAMPDTRQTEAALQKRLPDAKVEMKVRFTEWRIDEAPPADAFAFVPPEWAEKKESFLQPRAQDAALQLIGKAAPHVELALLDGTSFDLAGAKDKHIVILDFWASWCGPCVMALPILAEVSEQYKDKGVVLIAVNVEGTSPAVVEAFLKRQELDIDVALDNNGGISARYRVGPIPQTVIVGKDGIVQSVKLGFSPNLRNELAGDLEALLAGKNLY